MDDNEEFTLIDLAAKCRSKTELYNLLTRDRQLYLPPIQDATQICLRSLMMETKSVSDVKTIELLKCPIRKTEVRGD